MNRTWGIDWHLHYCNICSLFSFTKVATPFVLRLTHCTINGDFSGLAGFDRGGERIDAGDDYFTHALGDDSTLTSDQPAGLVILLEKGVIIPGTRILYGLIILQVILGTQVREKVDEFTKDDQGIVRGEWLDHAGLVDHLHRPLSSLF